MKTKAPHNGARRRAFTLVEMMAVVVIIGILAAVIAPKFFTQVSGAQRTTALRDIKTLESQVTMFRFQHNRFPEDLEDLAVEPSNVKTTNPTWKKAPSRIPGATSTSTAFPVTKVVSSKFGLWVPTSRRRRRR